MRVVGSLATKYAPPFSLILHYFIAAVVFNVLSIAFLFNFLGGLSGPFYIFKYATEVHLFLLGFVLMTIFGALYQLIPVALEIPVYSFKLGYAQFYLYLVGVIVFVLSLFDGSLFFYLPVGALLIYLSILLFLINFFMSLRKLERRSITSKFLIAGSISLLFGASLGVVLSFNFIYGFYPDIVRLVISHIIFTLFGFVFFVIMGVSMVLFPMFSLAHKFNDKYINVAFFIALLAVFSNAFILFTKAKFAYLITLLFIVLTLVFYLLQVIEIYRKRPRKTKDIGLDTMFFTHYLLALFILMIVIVVVRSKTVFATFILLMFGFINFLIYGSMYKIVPFLTWFHKFSHLVGKKKVPMLADMLPKELPNYQVWTSFAGLVVLVGSSLFGVWDLFTIGVSVMLIGALLFAYTFFYVLNYKLEG